MVIYGIFIMAVGKAAMHRSYLYPHNPTFGALSQGRARFFCAKAGVALLFQHKLCWARKLRSNTPCPGSTFSCTDCLVHTNRAGGSPLTDGGFFAEPQLECAAHGGGNVPRPAAGQEGRHQGFYPLNSHFLLRESGADYRHVTAAKRSTAEDFFFRVFRNLFAVPDTVLLHRRFTLRRARHSSAAQLVSLEFTDGTCELGVWYNLSSQKLSVTTR